MIINCSVNHTDFMSITRQGKEFSFRITDENYTNVLAVTKQDAKILITFLKSFIEENDENTTKK